MANNKHYPQPVVIGTELTGLLISIALSRARVAHILIGPEADDSLPRIGQILTPVGTPIFAEHFPELAHLAYPKKQRVVHFGDRYMQLDFSHSSLAPALGAIRALGGPQFKVPWNLDRVAVDKALFAKAVHAPYCRHVESPAASVDYDPTTDTIRSVTLADGAVYATSHLFDASGAERFLGHQLGLTYRSLGAPQSVVHAVYRHGHEQPGPRLSVPAVPEADWYHHRANVLRLYRQQVGIDGLATCVPLGDHVSIHVCSPLQASDSECNEEPLPVLQLRAAQEAFAQVGIHVQTYFPTCTETRSAMRAQSVCARGYGTNWLLTGSAYAETLVTIAANTDPYLAAIYAGVPFLRDTATVGALYQKYLDYALIMQESWQWGLAHAPVEATEENLRHYLDRYVWANQTQYFVFLQLKYFKQHLRPGFGLLNQFLDHEYLSHLSAPYASVEQIHR